MKKTLFILTPLATALSAALPTGAAAQDRTYEMEEITVTARKRSETLQDVPFAVQALSQNQMRARGVTDLESLSNNVAGFTVQNLGPGQSQVAIRGISAGQIVRDQPGVKEQVGIYLDESVISLSLFTPDLDMYDMNRVEVLRGPQGTLFGSGSLSGTVRHISNQPLLGEFEANISAGLNSISDGGTGGEIKGMVNLPLTDDLALRVVGYTTEYAGYIDAVQPDGSTRDEVNEGNRYGFRAALTYQPSDQLTITPRVIYQEIEMDGFNREDDFNILGNELTTTQPQVRLGDYEQFTQLEEKFEDEFTLLDVVVNYDFDAFTLTSVTSWTEREVLVLRDATALTASITGGSYAMAAMNPDTLFSGFTWDDSVYRLDAPLFDRTDVEMLTQELRLASNDDGPLQWVVGIFYSDIEREYSQDLPVTGFQDATGGFPTAGTLAPRDTLFFSRIPYDFEQIAVFGEVDFAVTDKFTVTAGLRWYDFEETRTLSFDGIFVTPDLQDPIINLPGETSTDGVSPRIMINYEASDDMSINAQVSRGFRLGGINDPLNAGVCDSDEDRATFGGRDAFEDEELTNYEVGTKMTIMDGRGTLNISLFHSDIDDLQATVDAGSCSSRIVFNVPEATSTGIEFEFQSRLTDNFELALTGSVINAELGSTVNSVDADGNVTVVAGLRDGNALPTVPEVQGAVAGTYYFNWSNSLEGAATLSYQYVGERHTQTSDLDPATGTVALFTNIGDIPAEDGTLTFDPILGSYTIGNFRLSARADNWEAAFYINNINDEKADLSLDRERGLLARIGRRVNQPRTFGVGLNYSF